MLRKDWDQLPMLNRRESLKYSLAAGIGDPRLPLLTEGSRIFRVVVPRNEAQQKRIFAFFSSAGPYRLISTGNLGLAVPGPDKSNLPIVLRHGADGLWYVDEAKSWTYFHRFENNVNFFVKYADNPFLSELRALHVPNMSAAIYGTHVPTPPAPVYPFALAKAVHELEENIRNAPNIAGNYAQLGDLYLFEANWLTAATQMYEKASLLAPEELTYHWRLMDLYLNTSLADKMLAQLQYLANHLPGDSQTQDWNRAYKRAYEFAAN